MYAAIEVVFPVFTIMLSGWAFVRFGFIGREGLKGITNFVFLLAIPALLFRAMANGAVDGDVDWSLLYAYYSATAVNFILAHLVGWKVLIVPADQRAVMGISVTFSNAVLIGIPVVQLAYGPKGLVPLLILISVHALILITIATLSLEISRGSGDRWSSVVVQSSKGILTNPIVVALIAGLAWFYTGWELPVVVDRFCDILGTGAGPAALFAVGASMAYINLQGDIRHIVLLTTMKLLLLPLWVWILMVYVFDVREDWIKTAVTMAALPIGANASLFAQRYELYEHRATGAVFLSTVLSIITLTVLIGFIDI